MPLKRLILLLSLMVIVTFIAGAVIYHSTVYFNRLDAARTAAEGEVELAAQRLTNEMVDWQRFGRALSITAPDIEESEEAVAPPRLERLVGETYGLRGISLVKPSGEVVWRVGDTETRPMACDNAAGPHSQVNTAADGRRSGLIHCLPLGAQGKASATLILNTQLDTLNYELPSGSPLTIILVDASGRVLAGGQIHAIERYPVTRDEEPLTGSVHLAGEDYAAASVPVAGLNSAHLVALTSHKTVWSRALEPLLAPAGIVYTLMAAVLIVLVRTLYVAAGRDVQRSELVQQKLRRSEALYRELSISDSLTGLYNRRKFHNDLHQELSRNQRYDRPLSLAVMDVDDFKQINDTYGHNEGDRALRLIGRVLRSTRRKTDTAYRVGGEEFVLMLPETTADEAVNVATRMQASLADTCLYTEDGDAVTIALSVGIAQFNGRESERELFNRADTAMYAVKHKGKGGLRVADDTPTEALARPD